MYRSFAPVTVALALAGCHPAHPKAPAPAPQAPTTLDPDAIDHWLGAELARRGVVGASVVVVHDGATVFAKGYGTKVAGENAPIGPDTPFAIGSISKQLTCAAAMLMVEDGKLAMTDPVAKYYPNLVRAADISLDDLGAHLSGYRDYYPLDYTDARMETPIAPDDLLAKYAGLPLDFEPRTRRSYSNTGFVLLGRAIEKAAGTSLHEILADRIFGPLHMDHTLAGSVPPGAATGHDAFFLGPPHSTPPEASGWLFGAADVYASAADLARWDLAFSTGHILSDASRAAMTAIHHTSDGREVPYGCGLAVKFDRGERVLSHSGEVAGFLSFNTFIPRTRSAAILLVNDLHAEIGDLEGKLVDLLLERPENIPAIPGPSAEDTAREILRDLQAGKVDRSRMADDFAGYLEHGDLASAASRLTALGEPTSVTVRGRHERGGWEATSLDLVFAHQTLHASMFRAPNGKVHQFLLSP